MILRPEELVGDERYKLLTGAILPRPIAWVSTVSVAGDANLAPFSYFTAVCSRPMTLLFCPGIYPSGKKKDTWINIEQTGEFVINLTNEETAEQMNLSATPLPYGRSEFEWSGVTAAPSEVVRPPRVAESPVSFECTLQQIVSVSEGPGGGAAVFGEVQCIHIRDEIYADGYVDLEAYQPIGRLVGAGYVHISDTFEMKRVPPPEGS
jgi:flavin reductase (DIM6/NTAB) family NADH-FMN oxidoreductase RutF